MFLVFLQGAIIPHEWLHQLIEAHQDTQDSAEENCLDYTAHFSSEHTHCDYLVFSILTFHPSILPTGKDYFFAKENFTCFNGLTISLSSHASIESRGPPFV